MVNTRNENAGTPLVLDNGTCLCTPLAPSVVATVFLTWVNVVIYIATSSNKRAVLPVSDYTNGTLNNAKRVAEGTRLPCRCVFGCDWCEDEQERYTVFWLVHPSSYQLSDDPAGDKHHANNCGDYDALSGHRCNCKSF